MGTPIARCRFGSASWLPGARRSCATARHTGGFRDPDTFNLAFLNEVVFQLGERVEHLQQVSPSASPKPGDLQVGEPDPYRWVHSSSASPDELKSGRSGRASTVFIVSIDTVTMRLMRLMM